MHIRGTCVWENVDISKPENTKSEGTKYNKNNKKRNASCFFLCVTCFVWDDFPAWVQSTFQWNPSYFFYVRCNFADNFGYRCYSLIILALNWIKCLLGVLVLLVSPDVFFSFRLSVCVFRYDCVNTEHVTMGFSNRAICRVSDYALQITFQIQSPKRLIRFQSHRYYIACVWKTPPFKGFIVHFCDA